MAGKFDQFGYAILITRTELFRVGAGKDVRFGGFDLNICEFRRGLIIGFGVVLGYIDWKSYLSLSLFSTNLKGKFLVKGLFEAF